ASAVTFTPQYAYVGSDNNGVIGFTVNPATGDLSANAAGSQPGLGDARAVSTDLRGRFLMVGAFSFNQLKSFTINPATGALTAVSTIGSGALPFAVAVDPSGRFAYTANKGSNTISTFTINTATGAVTKLGNDVGNATRDVTADPTGRFVYAASDSSG